MAAALAELAEAEAAAAEEREQVSPLYLFEHLVGENIHRRRMSLASLECQVSALVNSDACPRPTTQGAALREANQALLAEVQRLRPRQVRSPGGGALKLEGDAFSAALCILQPVFAFVV